MTQEQITQLYRIYNTLGTISTKGEDTIIMGDCLRALAAFIQECQQPVATTEGV